MSAAHEKRFAHRHLLSIAPLSTSDIEEVLATADAMRKTFSTAIKKAPTLRGRSVFTLFFEPSTRTRTSFEIAAKRLSADVTSFSGGTSSVVKGESLIDTVLTLDAMEPDLCIVRHKSAGAAELLTRHMRAPIINAGDGAHEHPSQALLDARTMLDFKGRLDGLTVAIVGDILHSRVARSNLLLLNKMGAHVRLAGPTTLVPREFASLGATLFDRVDDALDGADVVMALRIQLERQDQAFFPDTREYAMQFGINARRMRKAKKDAIVMHPGPMNRGLEIAPDVADGAQSVVLRQVENGIHVRTALIYLLMGASSLDA